MNLVRKPLTNPELCFSRMQPSSEAREASSGVANARLVDRIAISTQLKAFRLGYAEEHSRVSDRKSRTNLATEWRQGSSDPCDCYARAILRKVGAYLQMFRFSKKRSETVLRGQMYGRMNVQKLAKAEADVATIQLINCRSCVSKELTGKFPSSFRAKGASVATTIRCLYGV